MRIASIIDHTLLNPEASKAEVEKLCEEAVEHGFASVCVNGCHVEFACSCIRGSGLPVAAVVGFPLGAMSTEAKAFETRDAVQNGAGEIDMVINIGALKDGDYDYVLKDIKGVVEAAGEGVKVKVILETCLLSSEEIAKASALVAKSGAHFVKTSTGFSKSGATEDDIRLIRSVVGEDFGIKASGGIRTYSDAIKMVEAGATRIGASASVEIAKGEE
ncbi:deoxyribose-phosphate aldolase [Peptoclostridium litorale DSM 5388]|uniref:Deoxyribose-phosphate aldolase n=1 Tax=Peptoclostridium litorale DSM 5388 TaxID=1121324 RepID=A0A069RA31_PEPLI|nr:deoxyribose-phosphate aldolase [Peptoclostridium litorale]KDR93911.1 deoxyribose-phosphate aldolase DeoC [Peptoclostridium litorale DSM 5388]KDR95338.1 deoxyribose-phosphate aldolase DeoC [Peptoclostridium litorale DSM 5388]SIN88409.1 deoxyribose-phosphate aldolase [Peptoclostridium litorale DSM 5388]